MTNSPPPMMLTKDAMCTKRPMVHIFPAFTNVNSSICAYSPTEKCPSSSMTLARGEILAVAAMVMIDLYYPRVPANSNSEDRTHPGNPSKLPLACLPVSCLSTLPCQQACKRSAETLPTGFSRSPTVLLPIQSTGFTDSDLLG